jgi:hypothetical protein
MSVTACAPLLAGHPASSAETRAARIAFLLPLARSRTAARRYAPVTGRPRVFSVCHSVCTRRQNFAVLRSTRQLLRSRDGDCSREAHIVQADAGGDPVWCQGQGNVDLYILFPIHLHRILLSYISSYPMRAIPLRLQYFAINHYLIISPNVSVFRESEAKFTDSCHPDDGGAKFLRNVGPYKSLTA